MINKDTAVRELSLLKNKFNNLVAENDNLKNSLSEGIKHIIDNPKDIIIDYVSPNDIKWDLNGVTIIKDGLRITLRNSILLHLKGSINTIK